MSLKSTYLLTITIPKCLIWKLIVKCPCKSKSYSSIKVRVPVCHKVVITRNSGKGICILNGKAGSFNFDI